MKQSYLRDQRGVAMVFELLLVAAVLTLAGLAIYQAHNRAKNPPVAASAVAPSSADGLAATAAAVSSQASATDAAVAASADSAASDAQTDSDVNNLMGSSNATF